MENKVLEGASYSIVNTLDPAAYQQAVTLIIVNAQMEAYHTVFVCAALVLLVGAALALTIHVKEIRNREIMLD